MTEENQGAAPAQQMRTEVQQEEEDAGGGMAMLAVTGLSLLDPAFTRLAMEALSRRNHLPAEAVENAVEWRTSDAWMIRRGSQLPGVKLALSQVVITDAAGVHAKGKEEFMQGKTVGWDPKMKPTDLRKYLERQRIQVQAQVALALAEDCPLGRHTGAETVGAELLLAAMGGRLAATNLTFVLRPETWLEGIDSNTTISSWRENAYHAGGSRWQMEVQMNRGPWATEPNAWTVLAWAAAHAAHLGAEKHPEVHLYAGTSQWLDPLDQLQRNFKEKQRVVLEVGPRNEDVQDPIAQAIDTFREELRFRNNTSDVRLALGLDDENPEYVGSGRYTFVARWSIRKIDVRVRRSGAGGVGGAVALASRSLGDINRAMVLNMAPNMPSLLVWACRLLGQSSWLAGYSLPDGLGGDRGVCLANSGGGAAVPVRAGMAQLARYWTKQWSGTGCVNRALYSAASRLVAVGGSEPEELRADAATAAMRGLRVDDPANIQGLSPFRCHTARSTWENASLNPLVVWAVENDKVIRVEEHAPQFYMDPAGITRALRRLATLLSLHSDRAHAHAQLPGVGTIYGAGWAGSSDYGNETGYEMMTAIERTWCLSWNAEWGASIGMEVSFDVCPPEASSVGHSLVWQDGDHYVCTQRIPTWCWGVYSSGPYLTAHEAPKLGKAVFVKASNGAVAAKIGQHFDISEYPMAQKAVFITAKGSVEDDVSSPYPIALLQNGRYYEYAHSAAAQHIDAALTVAGTHNRGMSTVPWNIFGLGDTVQYQLVVKARSPPQPGGLVCLGHNCIPQWAADAPSHGRVVVENAHLAAMAGVARFRL